MIGVTAAQRRAALTSGEHEGTLAHAVVVVHVLGAEVCSVDHQAALSARRPTVALQEEPETHPGGGAGESRVAEDGGVSSESNKDSEKK